MANAELKKSDNANETVARTIVEAGGLSTQQDFEAEKRKDFKEKAIPDQRWQRQMEFERKEIESTEQWRKLRRRGKSEFNDIERKFDDMSRWGVSVGVMFGLITVVAWFWVYKDNSLLDFRGTRSPTSVAATDNSRQSAKITQLLSAAEQGKVKAQLELGMAYTVGKEIAKDENQAALWIEKAAAQGDASAQDMLGYFYANGKGVARDKEQAINWYRKAAEQGNVNAQFNLAIAYKDGIGLAKDSSQAIKWFSKAAEQGDAEAQTILGKIYEYGLFGVVQNESRAEFWYQKAAEQGNQQALDALMQLQAWLRD